MATSTKIRPPFVWLGQYTAAASVILTVAIGAFFRFYQLGGLPPGLDGSTAAIGLQAVDLAEHGWFPSLSATNGYAPLWVWLQAVAVKLCGHTSLALRLWPALLGTLAILTTWLWLRSWFSLRLAWLTAFLLAVTPWAVTLSRGGTEAALWPLLVSLTLWVATRAWRTGGRSVTRNLLLAAVLTLNLLGGPVGWLLVLVVVVAGAVLLWRTKQLFATDRARLTGGIGLAVGLGILGYLAGLSLTAIKALPQATGLVNSFGTLGRTLVRVLLMFNVAGDQNYRHNLAGEPLLNAFVGLMLVAGVLVGISRLHERRYRLLFMFLVVLLLPAVITTTGAPNAARAAGALPLVLAFAATGISYMLELWYQTFPINSAARATGQSAIIVLLGLTLFQGYTQYFHAWAGSSAVYTAYNEGAVRMAAAITTDKKFTGQRFMVASADELTVISYLDHEGPSYTALQASDLVALPTAAPSRQFLIAAGSRDEATKTLKAKFPGGVLVPHYSDFNQDEIYYTYEVGK